MFSRKIRIKMVAKVGPPTGKFPVVPLTRQHSDILSEIKCPWSEIFDPANAGIPKAEILRNALRSVTEDQVVEFVFVVSRPASDSRAVLRCGRNHFTQAAMDHALKFICRADLEKIVANGAPLVAATIRAPAASRSTPYYL